MFCLCVQELQSKTLVMETSDTNVSSLSVPNLSDPADSTSPADLCSAPNLSSSNAESSAVSLLETFAAVARQRASGGSGGVSTTSTNANNSRNTANSLNSGIFGRGLTTNSVSSLVRLALSSNFPSGLLNQVYLFDIITYLNMLSKKVASHKGLKSKSIEIISHSVTIDVVFSDNKFAKLNIKENILNFICMQEIRFISFSSKEFLQK